MRDVLVVLFWTWLLVALGIYAYRAYRRVTKGPKAERLGHDADTSTPETSGKRRFGGLGPAAPPPLPEGPVEARLPRSLQGTPPSAAPFEPVAAPGEPVAEPAPPAPGPRVVTLADALQGIQMPEGLLPVVSTDEPGITDDRRARFSATGTNVPLVAVSLSEELRRLGFAVDGMDTMTSNRAGLTATRDETAVAATIEIDEDSGAVVVDLKV